MLHKKWNSIKVFFYFNLFNLNMIVKSVLKNVIKSSKVICYFGAERLIVVTLSFNLNLLIEGEFNLQKNRKKYEVSHYI